MASPPAYQSAPHINPDTSSNASQNSPPPSRRPLENNDIPSPLPSDHTPENTNDDSPERHHRHSHNSPHHHHHRHHHGPSRHGLLRFRPAAFLRSLTHRPAFLITIVAVSFTLLSIMYSIRNYLVEPSQAVPEFIPQAAVVTVPGTNITLAARPAAFGPLFPVRRDADDEREQSHPADHPFPLPPAPHERRGWNKNSLLGDLFGITSDDDASPAFAEPAGQPTGKPPVAQIPIIGDENSHTSSNADKKISTPPPARLPSPPHRAPKHATHPKTNHYVSPFDDPDLDEDGSDTYESPMVGGAAGGADVDMPEEDEEGNVINYFFYMNQQYNKTGLQTAERGLTGRLTIVAGSGCSPVVGYQDLSGRIALVMRGDCSFYQKVLVLQSWGAAAVIVGDNVYRNGLITMYSTSDPDLAEIPAVFVSRASYDVLLDVETDMGPKTVVEITTVDASGPIIGPVLFLLVSPLCSLTLIYGLLLFHRRYKRVKERAPKWVVDNLPRRTWVNPYGADNNEVAGSASNVATNNTVLGHANEDEDADEGSHLIDQTSIPQTASSTASLSPTIIDAGDSNDVTNHAQASTTAVADSQSSASSPAPECSPPKKIWVSSGECIICLEDYVSGESVVLRLPCGHEFHEQCIRRWLLGRKRTCPICKMDVTVVVNEEQRKARGRLAWALTRWWNSVYESLTAAIMVFRRSNSHSGSGSEEDGSASGFGVTSSDGDINVERLDDDDNSSLSSSSSDESVV